MSASTTVVSCELVPLGRAMVTTASGHRFCVLRSERHMFEPGTAVVLDGNGWRPADEPRRATDGGLKPHLRAKAGPS